MFIIYGAGRIGKQVLRALKSNGFVPEFFWDKNATKIGELLEEIPVLEPDFESVPPNMRSKYFVVVTVAAKDVGRQIGENLIKLGYNVIHERADINGLVYRTCQTEVGAKKFVFNLETCRTCPVSTTDGQSSCDIFNLHLAKLAGSEPGKKAEGPFVIPRLGLLVGNKCNLCCQGCNHLVDLYKPGEANFLKTDQLIEDVERIATAVDLINKVVVVGGESFLHPDLHEIIRRLLDLPKIGFVQIITNGTIIPKDSRLLELLANKRVMVEISGYGSELTERISKNVEGFRAQLEQHKVNYTYLGTLQWFDFGNFDLRPYSEEEHAMVYRDCCSVSNDIWNGRLYKCSRSAIGTHLGHLPDFPLDYVDLRQHSGLELREKLAQFFAHKRPRACLHCNGASANVVIEAGVQVTRFKIHQ